MGIADNAISIHLLYFLVFLYYLIYTILMNKEIIVISLYLYLLVDHYVSVGGQYVVPGPKCG